MFSSNIIFKSVTIYENVENRLQDILPAMVCISISEKCLKAWSQVIVLWWDCRTFKKWVLLGIL
jgi:hypothetical protein